MNGLNSPALHVGVNLSLLLAEKSSVQKDPSCDWSGCLGAVGVFYRRWKWDTLWQCSLSIFHWSCRRCAAESLSLLAEWGFAAYGPRIRSSKACKSWQKHQEEFPFFLLDLVDFLFKVLVRVHERPWHFLLTTYLRFCLVCPHLCSI